LLRGGEAAQELTGAVQLAKLFEAANVVVVDEDLRDRPASRRNWASRRTVP